MTEMYAMQRANGDWFALNERGRLCVPVFNSNSDAMHARLLNFEMLHFKPMKLDERAINDLRPAKTEEAASFLIISDPTLNLSRGRSIDYAQFELLSRNGQEESQLDL
jgi:hypothetical protein